jgi:3-dehydroquinate synthase
MKTVTVTTSLKSYNVCIGQGLLKKAGQLSAEVLNVGIAAVVTDTTVDLLYADALIASLQSAGFRTIKFCFPAGEKSKNASTLIDLLNFLAANRLSRTDTIFALGGGVVGDLAGLAAAMYLRGVRLVQLPTTVLAAVDSSVGGKTAIDLEAGKNLAGVFYQPDLVICDTATLSTLPEKEFSNGCAEIIKYAAIRDADLFTAIQPPFGERLTEIITRCVEIKRDVVGRDEQDTGERQILNFGHTFGHAIEKCSGYTIPHGSAVAAGMAMITRACVKKELCGPECLAAITAALHRFSLPTTARFGEEELFAAMLSDKKRASDRLTLVVPREIGRCERLTVSLQEAREFLHLGLEGEICHESGD